MSISDLLEKKGSKVYSILPDGTLKEAVKLFNQKHIGALLVINKDKKLEGIVTERDVLTKLSQTEGEIKNMFVKTIMTSKEKLIVGTREDNIEYLLNVMTNNRIRHIPIVCKEGKLEGMISIGDCVKALLHDAHYENRLLKDYIEGKYPI